MEFNDNAPTCRFDLPLTRIYRYALPYIVILLITVLLITYWPAMTLWLSEVMGFN